MLTNFKDIIDAAKRKNELILATNSGLFSLTRLVCTIILDMYAEKIGIKTRLIRTTYKNKIPKEDNVIIYSFKGIKTLSETAELCDEVPYHRGLSSLGKLWRFGKTEFIEAFGLDESSWSKIDNLFIFGMDKSETSAAMDPLTYGVLSLRDISPNLESWDICYKSVKPFVKGVLDKCRYQIEDNKKIKNFRIIEVNGKKFRYNDKWCFGVDPSVSGFVWKSDNNTYMIKVFDKTDQLRYKGMCRGTRSDILYVSWDGRHGEVASLEDLSKIVSEKNPSKNA